VTSGFPTLPISPTFLRSMSARSRGPIETGIHEGAGVCTIWIRYREFFDLMALSAVAIPGREFWSLCERYGEDRLRYEVGYSRSSLSIRCHFCLSGWRHCHTHGLSLLRMCPLIPVIPGTHSYSGLPSPNSCTQTPIGISRYSSDARGHVNLESASTRLIDTQNL
jgi:hypothetical protein